MRRTRLGLGESRGKIRKTFLRLRHAWNPRPGKIVYMEKNLEVKKFLGPLLYRGSPVVVYTLRQLSATSLM